MPPINQVDFQPTSAKSAEYLTIKSFVPGGDVVSALLFEDEPKQYDESHYATPAVVYFNGDAGRG